MQDLISKLYSTDGSMYQILPLAVMVPKNKLSKESDGVQAFLVHNH
jgi:hypothetical protein